jgi:propionyl-CoA carboxylase alpha chain
VRRIGTLLVANRGEIARRVARSARDMGIAVAAVYADQDAAAPYVREADLAVPLAGATARATYLDAAKLVAAARAAGADAVHPGYGFLAEHPGFAQAVVDAGLLWVGPSPKAIAAMGDKLAALDTVEAAGVRTLPRAAITAGMLDGLPDGIPDGTPGALAAAAADVGYPLLVKAAAGGGGRGIRLVAGPRELADAVVAARREAAASFGSDAVYLERFLDPCRHVEVQVLGDAHGTVWDLGERECSIQRRRQKVVEEAPSPFVDQRLRAELGAAAVAAARAIGYEGAGTVECVVAADGTWAFHEMNTRLQVEHPVTELVRGVDLVREQLRVAMGLPLDPAGPPAPSGVAIEARLYAEDPARGFLPATGTITTWRAPAGAGVRVDSGVEAGTVVGSAFDPMLAKVVAHAPTRDEAAARLAAALRGLRVHGVTTNRAFLVDVVEHPAFLAGDTWTDFIDRHGLAGPGRAADPAWLRRAAVAAAVAVRVDRAAAVAAGGDLPAIPPGWRNNRSTGDRAVYDPAGAAPGAGVAGRDGIAVEVWPCRDGGLEGSADGEPFRARVHARRGIDLDLELDGVRERLTVAVDGAVHTVQGRRGEARLVERPRFPRPGPARQAGGLVAPITGVVAAVRVAVGEQVDAGTPLVVVEAMKMEHPVTAPAAGTVREVRVEPGDRVDADALLVVLDDAPADDVPDGGQAAGPAGGGARDDGGAGHG